MRFAILLLIDAGEGLEDAGLRDDILEVGGEDTGQLFLFRGVDFTVVVFGQVVFDGTNRGQYFVGQGNVVEVGRCRAGVGMQGFPVSAVYALFVVVHNEKN